MTKPDVRIGQVWQDWDTRNRKGRDRFVRVLALDGLYVLVENTKTGRESLIAARRFKPNSTGYRLVTDDQT